MDKSEKIILASASPRRKEILERNGVKFEILVPKGEEKNIVGEKYSETLVNDCAVEKAKSVWDSLCKKHVGDSVCQQFVGADILCQQSVGADILSARGTTECRPLQPIVSCDTVVVNDGIIIGKPKDREDAVKILKSLSGKTHIVASSVCVMKGDDVKVAHEVTRVTFRELTEKEINDYIDRCNPLDKAGSYGIQDEKFDFVESIEGSMDNVVGFPIEVFKEMVNEL